MDVHARGCHLKRLYWNRRSNQTSHWDNRNPKYRWKTGSTMEILVVVAKPLSSALDHRIFRVALLMHLQDSKQIRKFYHSAEGARSWPPRFSSFFLSQPLTFNCRILKNRLSQPLHGNFSEFGCKRSICARSFVRLAARYLHSSHSCCFRSCFSRWCRRR